MFYNDDCIEGAKRYLKSDSVDLIITDPPYGIAGDTLHKHYNRNENHVLDGYVEVPAQEYPDFSRKWISEAARVLRPGGSIYIVSGYTHLIHILNALYETKLEEVNHIVWKYNFGVYTKNKFISSHYHILYYVKPGGKPTFNTHCRYSDSEKDGDGSFNYRDREDVWIINREYKPGKVKNKNELPTQLLVKMIQYSSNSGDLVCDFFLGSFSTAKTAIGLDRRAAGFEKSKIAFDYQISQMHTILPGSLLATLRMPPKNVYCNQGKPITQEEREAFLQDYLLLRRSGNSKKEAIETLTSKTGRGYWSLLKMVDGTTNKSIDDKDAQSLFEHCLAK